jgi:hypothetical protein
MSYEEEDERTWRRAVLEGLEEIRKAVSPVSHIRVCSDAAVTSALTTARALINNSCSLGMWNALDEACGNDVGLRERAVTALSAVLPPPYTNKPLAFFDDDEHTLLDDVFDAFDRAIGAQ